MKLRVTVNGVNYDVDVDILEDKDYATQVTSPTPAAPAPQVAAPRPPVAAAPRPAAPAPVGGNVLTSPIPGTVVEISVKVGQAVKANEQVLVLDAMKMNTQVNANADGVVKEILVNSGDAVKMGQALVTFE